MRNRLFLFAWVASSVCSVLAVATAAGVSSADPKVVCRPFVMGHSASWSPDGRRIAFARGGTLGTAIWLMRTNGTRRRLLWPPTSSTFADHPQWSPHGDELAFDAGGEVFTIRLDGTQLRDRGAGRHPSWSPDARHVAVTAGSVDAPEIDIIDLDSGARTKLVSTSNANAEPTWSPTGSEIAYETAVEGSPFASKIVVVRPDGTGARDLVVNAREPAWSPSGNELAFTRPLEDGASVNVVRADGSADHVLFRGRQVSDRAAFDPSWAPDGRRVIFSVGKGTDVDADAPLFIADVAGKSQHPVSPRCRFGTDGVDHMVGTRGADRLFGLNGDDVIRGGGGDDLIVGGPGRDILNGGPGHDAIYGGPDNDRIFASDGAHDKVVCGSGSDRVAADAIDFVAADCEKVRRTRHGSHPRP